jgi:hypothetical protein
MKIPATLRRFSPMILSIDDERSIDNGYWVNLKHGFIDEESGCHAIHETNLKECASRFVFVKPCTCNDCVQNIKP